MRVERGFPAAPHATVPSARQSGARRALDPGNHRGPLRLLLDQPRGTLRPVAEQIRAAKAMMSSITPSSRPVTPSIAVLASLVRGMVGGVDALPLRPPLPGESLRQRGRRQDKRRLARRPHLFAVEQQSGRRPPSSSAPHPCRSASAARLLRAAGLVARPARPLPLRSLPITRSAAPASALFPAPRGVARCDIPPAASSRILAQRLEVALVELLEIEQRVARPLVARISSSSFRWIAVVSRFCVFWIRNTIRNVTIVVPC